MENLFLIQEDKFIPDFQQTNPTKEDYADIVGENDPEFYLREIESRRSKWDDGEPESPCPAALDLEEDEIIEDEEDEIDRYDIELPFGYHEIELYDNEKTFEENFSQGSNKKYILFEIDKSKQVVVTNPERTLPTPQSKCVIDIEKVEDYSSLEFIPVDYDSLFGLRLLSFQKYKPDFFTCDERVLFEALLIKYQRFDFKPFYWSKEVIFKEMGIKKDRATKIIQKFIDLEILTKEVKSSIVDKRPQQITYYDLQPERIIELIPEIYFEREVVSLKNEIKKYLYPVLKKKK